MGDISSGSELLLHYVPLHRSRRAVQIFVLEFSKDGLPDLGDKVTDGGLANQPLILQGGVSLTCYQVFQVFQCYCQFQSNFLGFLKLLTDFLMQWCVCFL